MATFFFFLLFVLVGLLIEGGVYFIWKPGIAGTCSSTHSLSVLLSAVKTNRITHTALEIVSERQWELYISTCVHATCVLAAATSQGWHLLCSEFPVVRLQFEGSDDSRAGSCHAVDGPPSKTVPPD